MKEEVRNLNAYLDTFQSKVYETHRRLVETGADITAEAVKNKLTGTDDQPKMILEIFQNHNDQLAKLLGKDFAAGTLKRYKTSLEHTREYIKWKYKTSDLLIQKIDYDFISDFEFWFKTVRQCNHNTTMKYLANCKKIVLICVKKGWLARDPLSNFRISHHEVDRQALTANELNLISVKEFGQGRLAQVRDVFLFCCYTGQCRCIQT